MGIIITVRMKFEEILYCFTHAKSGKYGTLFSLGTPNAIRYETLAAWPNQYDKTDRQKAVEHRRMAEHGAHKGTPVLEANMGEVYERYIKDGPSIPQDNRPGKMESLKGMDEAFSKFKSEYTKKRILETPKDEDHD